MADLILLLGGNQGNRQQMIHDATDLIQLRIGSVVQSSSLYETAPWGNFDHSAQNFFNQALRVTTDLEPYAALNAALQIEQDLGRRRPPQDSLFSNQKKTRVYFSRPIDIDLIFYDDRVVDTPELQLPHPRMHLRRFVLAPLCEIMPDYQHPVLRDSLSQLLSDCPDPLPVTRVSSLVETQSL